jgi:hypothetical protein
MSEALPDEPDIGNGIQLESFPTMSGYRNSDVDPFAAAAAAAAAAVQAKATVDSDCDSQVSDTVDSKADLKHHEHGDSGEDNKSERGSESESESEDYAEIDDPLEATDILPIAWFARLDLQTTIASIGYSVCFAIGLTLTVIHVYDSNDEDLKRTLGDLLTDAGLGSLLIAVWQLISSQELAYRKHKWFGVAVSCILFVSGVVLTFISDDNPSSTEFFGNIFLSLGLGPALTTLLLLDPKEKETLAMPYVRNFVLNVSKSLAAKNKQFHLMVPVFPSVCANLKTRLRAYKEHNCIRELSVNAGGHKRFSVDSRNGEAIDFPSMLDGATPKKIQLFLITLREYLAQLREDNMGGENIQIHLIDDITLKCIDEALARAAQTQATAAAAADNQHTGADDHGSCFNIGCCPC